ncbi:hypothetical protein scyTo_0004487 [Scyliorhinus torazame]|uniref:Ig-like domain-containing protein n=1 Tax=Scyliorhinus torazame TaxID=75743 RepID=A0A401NSJ4_SCYTO|nr:hypothetical protein [Scyliorhinus torazame]
MKLVSLLIILWSSFPRKTRADVIQQWPTLMAANQGEAPELSCFQTDGSKNVMLWYRQDVDEGLRLMGYSINGIAASYEENFENKILILRPELKKSILRILTAKAADSAVYYCASSEHRAEDCGGANTKTSPVNNWGFAIVRNIFRGGETEARGAIEPLTAHPKNESLLFESFDRICEYLPLRVFPR